MVGPAVDADVTGNELDRSVVRELSTLRAEAAEQAGRHLVMAARLMGEDPELAYEHAMAARRCGPRVGIIREAVGIAAYNAEKWTEALAELRAARRISGGVEHWPMMADCERALGRPERALAMAAAPEAAELDRAGRVELRIVVAGARADMGQLDAAVVTLQTADLQGPEGAQWVARLRCAYAAALEAVGRDDEARTWYERAAASDPEGETGAGDRLAELDGIVFYDDDDKDDEDDEDEDDSGARGDGAARDREVARGEGTDGDREDVRDAARESEGRAERIRDLREGATAVVAEPADLEDDNSHGEVDEPETVEAIGGEAKFAGKVGGEAKFAGKAGSEARFAGTADGEAVGAGTAGGEAKSAGTADGAAEAVVAAGGKADTVDATRLEETGSGAGNARRAAEGANAARVAAVEDARGAGGEADSGGAAGGQGPTETAPLRRPAVTAQLFLEPPVGAQLEFDDADEDELDE
ncbi:MAG: hypothetical protein ACT4QF_21210 [Sporichthyaceae bacterium]